MTTESSPERYGAILAERYARDKFPARRKINGRDRVVVSADVASAEFASRAGVPHVKPTIKVARDDTQSIRRKCRRPDGVRVHWKTSDFGGLLAIPYMNGSVVTGIEEIWDTDVW